MLVFRKLGKFSHVGSSGICEVYKVYNFKFRKLAAVRVWGVEEVWGLGVFRVFRDNGSSKDFLYVQHKVSHLDSSKEAKQANM